MKTRKILRLSVIIGLLTVSLAKAQDKSHYQSRISNRVDTVINGKTIHFNYITKKYDGEYYFDESKRKIKITKQLAPNKIKKLFKLASDGSLSNYSIIERDSIGHFKYSDYNIVDGAEVLASEQLLKDTINDIAIFTKEYYNSGKLKLYSEFDTISQKRLKLKAYYENGAVRRDEIYKDGVSTNKKLYDSLGHEIQYIDYEIEPVVNIEKITAAIHYPEIFRRYGIEEYLALKVLLGEDSKPIKILYDTDNSKEFIDAALYAIKSSQIFTTAKQEGVSVSYWVIMPFSFTLR